MLAVETEARCIDDGGFQAGKQREFICFAFLFFNPSENLSSKRSTHRRRGPESCLHPWGLRGKRIRGL